HAGDRFRFYENSEGDARDVGARPYSFGYRVGDPAAAAGRGFALLLGHAGRWAWSASGVRHSGARRFRCRRGSEEVSGTTEVGEAVAGEARHAGAVHAAFRWAGWTRGFGRERRRKRWTWSVWRGACGAPTAGGRCVQSACG